MAPRKPPLTGLKVIELAGLAPAPYAGLILADHGADVIRVDRLGRFNPDNLARGKRSISLNLKDSAGIDALLRILDHADVLIDPFRPGVLEKLGLGPEVLQARNPRLIIARLTGYGQTGPFANMAGHDINYIALSGALDIIGRKGEKPMFPGNLLGDFAGGGMLCAMGVMLALLERSKSGKGQVVDAAMIDGATYLASFIYKMRAVGAWHDRRGENMLDSGAHFYDTYETKDGKYMSVGAIEPQFYKKLLKGMGLKAEDLPNQLDTEQWPAMAKRFTQVFKSKTRDEWCAIFDGTDACVAPVLGMGEVMNHGHPQARSLLIEAKDETGLEPAPAPRLSATPAVTQQKSRAQPQSGEHMEEVMKEYGFTAKEVAALAEKGAVGELRSNL